MRKAKHTGACLQAEGFVSVMTVNRYFASTSRDLHCLVRCVKWGSAIFTLPLFKAGLHSSFWMAL